MRGKVVTLNFDDELEKLFSGWLKNVVELHKNGIKQATNGQKMLATGSVADLLSAVNAINDITDALLLIGTDASARFNELVDAYRKTDEYVSQPPVDENLPPIVSKKQDLPN